MIDVRDLTFAYESGPIVLRGVSFDIERGQCLGIIGSNGSGKSTLVNCISGVIPHLIKGDLKGKVEVLGKRVGDVGFEEIISNVGFVMQNPDDQFIGLTVEDELRWALGERPQLDVDRRVEDISRVFGIADLSRVAHSELSLGQKQRVILASVLARMPRLLILDEPFAFLDLPSQELILKVLSDLKKEGVSIVVVTHRIELIRGVVDRILALKEGEALFFKDADFLSREDIARVYGLSSYGRVSRHRAAAAKSVLLRAEEVYFRYPRGRAWALQDITLEIAETQRVGLFGRNGSGKSSLLLVLAGLLRPNPGRVLVRGEDIHRMSFRHLAKLVGIVFQNPTSQLFERSIEEEISFGLRNLKLGPMAVRSQVDRVRDLFGLSDLTRDPSTLSYGWKKILTIAIALAMDPEVVLLDEPDLNLDPLYRDKIVSLIDEMGNQGKTIFVASHDPSLIGEATDLLVFLEEGRIRAAGSTGEQLPLAVGLLKH